MMTNEERIRTLKDFGYADREAEFLCMAALHSGFFLRRQYLEYLGAKSGYADDLLIQRIVNLGHGRLAVLRQTQLCHLSSRAFYTAIGEPDNRHRRMRPLGAIRIKLMALDYVLAHPDATYLATETEKLWFFCGKLGIAKENLPARTYRSKTGSSTTDRYFVDKFPISLAAESPSSSPVVSFSYIDEGEVATPGFETWLLQYARLFSALDRFRVVFVSTRETRFPWAERYFRCFFDAPSRSTQAGINPSVERLLRYYRLENAFRERRLAELDAGKLDDLRRLRKEFASRWIERLFTHWKEQGDRVVVEFFEEKRPSPSPGDARFVTFKIPWDYELFRTCNVQSNDPGGGRGQKASAHSIL